jgi:glycosyltransferase involved in cell wall biosynthesis
MLSERSFHAPFKAVSETGKAVPDLSIVIPIFCERENLHELRRRLIGAMEALGRSYEIVFVNDHSRDDSLEILRGFASADPHIRIVSFSAITAGMQFARGRAVLLMDGDLQDPPEVIPDLLRKQEEGNWDIVYAIRKRRKEPAVIRLLYYIFYRLMKRTSYVDVPVDAGDFCIMSRRVVDQLNSIPERNRFVRGLRSWIGFRQTGLEFERAARFAGEPKYTFRSLFKLAFDGIFSFSFIPLRISTILGLSLSAMGMLYAAYVFVLRLMGSFQKLQGWSTLVVINLVIGGAVLVMLGIMGEYLGRIYEEIKGRPQYIVEEIIGFDSEAAPRDSARDADAEPPKPADETRNTAA